MSIGQKGSHSRGPILGDNKSGDGLWEDFPLAVIDQIRSPYIVLTDDFKQIIADETAFNLLGATATASLGVAANTITGVFNRLTINAGTAANTGYASVQFNSAGNSAVNNRYNVVPFTTGSVASGAGKELAWFARIGLVAATAGAWDGGALFGVFVTDTALLDLTTLLPTVAAGGGIGFHIGPTGVLSYVCNDSAITAAGTTITTIPALTTSAVFYDFGIRYKVSDFTNQKGNADFYFGAQGNMQKIASTYQDGTLPITNTTVYSPSYAIINGAALATDIVLDAHMFAYNRQAQTGTV